MAKLKPKGRLAPNGKLLAWRIFQTVYFLGLVIVAIYAVHSVRSGYTNACGTIPGNSGKAALVGFLFLPALLSSTYLTYRPPRRWWSAMVWLAVLLIFGAAAVLAATFANFSLCLTDVY